MLDPQLPLNCRSAFDTYLGTKTIIAGTITMPMPAADAIEKMTPMMRQYYELKTRARAGNAI
jgi:hypothetical protein